jgi:nitrogen fixation NifU-like protein
MDGQGDELRELYQTMILDHNKNPRNFGHLESPTASADGHNPLCGDELTVELVVDDDDRVVDVAFTGSGCAISTASASLMTDFVKGKTVKEVEVDFGHFHDLVTAPATEDVEAPELGKLAVFSGVREFPMRVKCATLCWHTLRSALAGGDEVAKTE